jgi:hypothetical protein
MMRMMNSRLRRRIQILLHPRPIRSPERLFLERVVTPALGLYRVRSVLFAGVAQYTWHCRRFGMTLHTIDRRPEAATWGAHGRHVVGDLEQAQGHFPGQAFDLVVLMDVTG